MNETEGRVAGTRRESPEISDLERPVIAAEAVAARISTDEHPMGPLGRPFDRRSPFFIGMAAAAGVAVTYGLVEAFLALQSVLILIGLAMFLAFGLEPAVAFLRRWTPRWAAVTLVLAGIVGVLVAFLVAAVPVLVHQGAALVHDIPVYGQQLQDHHSWLGRLNDQFQIQAKLQTLLSSSSSTIFTGVLGVGAVLFSAITNTLIVLVLTIYFLTDLPRIRALVYRLIPDSRRPRAILIGDDISTKVGGYVLGNVIISLISGGLTLVWLLMFSVPYALLLSLMVALLDLVPVIGSTLAGIVVALVALTVSIPVCLGTIGYFVVYRLAEDYFLIPRIIGRTVKVPALATIVAVLIGGALLGIVGALVAIPAAAAALLLVREILLPRLDRN
ncbi:MAG: AI-2E family transporter [Nakamurella sp.]